MIAPDLAEAPAAAPLSTPAREKEFSIGPWSASALAVVLLSLLGVVIRFLVARQSVFADELSTYWISATHSLGGVMSLMYGNAKIPHAEITPPLYFVTSWFTTQFGHSPELLRLPSLLAGALTLPVVYLLGLRTVGRPAALLATAVTALSPFMIYYSAEARSYAVMMLLTTSSTLAMLLAIDTRRTRWWVVYAVCSCAAIYTHYTCVFVLFAQFAWLVSSYRELRRPAVLANIGVVVGLLPWTGGLINDFDSPTTKILSAISPFTLHDVWTSLEHWALGFPYVAAGGLRGLPGVPALLMLALAAVLVVAGIGARAAREGARAWLARLDRRLLLLFALALSVPVGEAVVSAFSTHIFGVRNLAASWPALALSSAAIATATGPRLRLAASALAIVAFGLGAVKMLATRYERPDYQAAADFIQRDARAGDVVVDATGILSPGPVTGLDVVLRGARRVFRAYVPRERDHPFGIFEAVIPITAAIPSAVAAADGHRVFVVTYAYAPPAQINPIQSRAVPSRYHLVETRTYPNLVRQHPLSVNVYAAHSSTQ